MACLIELVHSKYLNLLNVWKQRTTMSGTVICFLHPPNPHFSVKNTMKWHVIYIIHIKISIWVTLYNDTRSFVCIIHMYKQGMHTSIETCMCVSMFNPSSLSGILRNCTTKHQHKIIIGSAGSEEQVAWSFMKPDEIFTSLDSSSTNQHFCQD